MSTLEKAIAISARAHEGQTDKGGSPYILHPLKVMLRLAHHDERIVAVLHDVVEDTRVTLADLRNEGFSEAVLAAIDSLTKREGETYQAFIERAGRDPLARRVKLADLAENSDLSRLDRPSQNDLERVEKYRKAAEYLSALTGDAKG
ncbi:HD domain-containing protein [Pseudomonas mediterranea]|uniref:HD domain-containing protein n=1 Tax=Pseudomonas mediterranea TaxID=183795 RepID=A0AAX2DBG4_9PSED|nr:HD domain-containing protein [Pseudomonas mediterranea]KGU85886.1 GTP pyrophosphokinase [Pseudomonas mediterranea CFBP 5447]MDU9030872.1 HD domain-containing protein [Pseudomonas mediterranea]QHA83515.1 HD domain-containing protein [Pseudomonas mediterranea]SDU48914.1 HD domain-containing protein [Pseudomonas mediterranea]